MKHARHRRARRTADTGTGAADAEVPDSTDAPIGAAEGEGWWTPLAQALPLEVDADEGDHPDR